MRGDLSSRLRVRGAAVAELAILTPVLLAMLFAVIEFGYYFMGRQVVHHAAAEAVRLATTPGYEGANGTATIRSMVESMLSSLGPEVIGAYDMQRQEASTSNACERITITVPTEAVMSGFPNFIFAATGIDDILVQYTVTSAHPTYAGTIEVDGSDPC